MRLLRLMPAGALVLAGVLLAAGRARCQQTLTFEAEDVSSPDTAWLKDAEPTDHWNLWSKDVDAEKKWSGGKVLQGPKVLADRERPEDGAPVLHTVLTGIPRGWWFVTIKYGRELAVSLDGKQWKRLSEMGGRLGRFEVTNGRLEFWVDDRFAARSNPGYLYYDSITLEQAPASKPKKKVAGWAQQRVEEKLDRGVVALPAEGGRAHVSWRLLKEDPADVAFNLYRTVGQAPAVKLNAQPLARTTDFMDDNPPAGSIYSVRAVAGGKEAPASGSAALQAQPYVSLKLQGDYTVQKVGIADLNGDGKLDYVLKTPGDNIDPYEQYWTRSPDTYKLEAYLNDGTFLWRHDMGWAIERGIWYSPYLVYDLDGDGKAEVALKAGEGDPRDAEGKVKSGPEYLSILDGLTGREKARVDWPKREAFGGYNYASRNQLGIAFLDGKTPCLLVARGTYTVMQVVAYQFHGGKLEELWRWDNREEAEGNWRGQGAHWMHSADVDGDGRDEVVLGSCVLDDDGKGLWTTGLGHPDRCFVTDIDPDNPGMEIFYHIEPAQRQNGLCVVDARTGKILWGLQEQTHHVGFGMCADIDPAHPGCECWAGEDPKGDPKREKYNGNPPRWLVTDKGEVLARDKEVPSFCAVYWDADPLREIVSGSRITKLDRSVVAQGIEGSQIAWADVLGDWREEIITSLKGEVRIYSTTIPAADRRPCLMQDPVYRHDVAHLAMGYAQPACTSYAIK